MARRWPPTVERVASFLREAGAEARLEEFAEPTPTADSAARAVGCDLAQIVKSLVVDCGDRAVVVLVPGDRRADLGKVARAARCEEIRVAGPERVHAVTGFAPGAVAPFGLSAVDRVFVDRTVLQHDLVWVGAGSPNHLAAIAPTELMRLARADAIDACG